MLGVTARPDSAVLSRALEAALNHYRDERGLAPVTAHPVLAAAARQHSQRMANLGFFAHTDPHDDTSVQHRIAAVERRPWAMLAENLAGGLWTAESILQGWIDSPGHRANLELPEITRVGTAVAFGGPLRVYATQAYGLELPQPRRPSLATVRAFAGDAVQRAARRIEGAR